MVLGYPKSIGIPRVDMCQWDPWVLRRHKEFDKENFDDEGFVCLVLYREFFAFTL